MSGCVPCLSGSPGLSVCQSGRSGQRWRAVSCGNPHTRVAHHVKYRSADARPHQIPDGPMHTFMVLSAQFSPRRFRHVWVAELVWFDTQVLQTQSPARTCSHAAMPAIISLFPLSPHISPMKIASYCTLNNVHHARRGVAGVVWDGVAARIRGLDKRWQKALLVFRRTWDSSIPILPFRRSFGRAGWGVLGSSLNFYTFA